MFIVNNSYCCIADSIHWPMNHFCSRGSTDTDMYLLQVDMETWRSSQVTTWPLLSTNTPLLSTQSAAVSTLSLLALHLYLAAIAVIGFQLRRFKLCNCNCCYKGEHFTLCRCLDWVLGQPAIDSNNCPRDKINNPPRGSPLITSSCSTHWEETFPDWQQPSSGGRAFRRNFQHLGGVSVSASNNVADNQ